MKSENPRSSQVVVASGVMRLIWGICSVVAVMNEGR